MALFLLLVCAAVLGLSRGQHSHPLHGICHNNHLQMTEDQVIERVVASIDVNHDTRVAKSELVVFFADLLGVTLPADVIAQLESMTDAQLLEVAGGMTVEKHTFVQAWHSRFHDSVEFITATFDAFDTSKDGALDVVEIEAIVSRAIATGDVNGDSQLENVEFVAFLESIYKNC